MMIGHALDDFEHRIVRLDSPEGFRLRIEQMRPWPSHLPACIAGGLGLEVDRAMDSFTPAPDSPAGLFEADDQLRGVAYAS